VICLEVMVNGETRFIAGASTAQTLTAELCTYPELQQQAWLHVSAEVAPDDQPPADADWPTTQLSVGDQVQIRVIESDSPTPPNVRRIEPTAPATDDIPFVCAFCGKTHLETQGMVASRKAMICRDCIGYLYEMTNEDADAAGVGDE
jgi:hypothetical protein